MQAIRAYYDGNAFVPLVPINLKTNQQVVLTITEKSASDDDSMWDRLHDTLETRERQRLAGAPLYTHEQIFDEIEEIYRVAEKA